MNTLVIFKEYLVDETLTLKVQPSWGSNFENHRIQIKEHLPAAGYYSISHCPSMGGFCGSLNFPIGFDIEEIIRVKPETVARVSSQQEVSKAPGSAELWAAKEACFKALKGPQQPQVVSSVLINAWENIVSNKDGHIFKFHADIKGNSIVSGSWGLVITNPTHVMAIFLLRN